VLVHIDLDETTVARRHCGRRSTRRTDSSQSVVHRSMRQTASSVTARRRRKQRWSTLSLPWSNQYSFTTDCYSLVLIELRWSKRRLVHIVRLLLSTQLVVFDEKLLLMLAKKWMSENKKKVETCTRIKCRLMRRSDCDQWSDSELMTRLSRWAVCAILSMHNQLHLCLLLLLLLLLMMMIWVL